jgi:hypothetical protein
MSVVYLKVLLNICVKVKKSTENIITNSNKAEICICNLLNRSITITVLCSVRTLCIIKVAHPIVKSMSSLVLLCAEVLNMHP